MWLAPFSSLKRAWRFADASATRILLLIGKTPMTRFTFSTTFFRYWFPVAAAARLAEIDPVKIT
jgi:hypothetical protein